MIKIIRPLDNIVISLGVTILAISLLIFMFKINMNNYLIFSIISIFLFISFFWIIKFSFKSKYDLLEPINIIYFFVILGYIISPILIYVTGNCSYLVRYMDDYERSILMAKASFFTLAGLICFYLGYNSDFSKKLGNILPSFNLSWNYKRAKIIILILSLIGFICYAYYAHNGGGIKYMLSNPEQRWYIYEKVPAGGYALWGIELLPLSIYIWFVNYITVKKRLSFLLYLLLICFIMATLGGRGRIIEIFLTMVLLYNYLIRRQTIIDIAKFLLIIVIPIIILFSIFIGNSSEENLQHASYLFSGEYFGGLASFMHILKYIGEGLGPYYGRTFISLLYYPIPRVLWPNKPVSAGRLILLPFYPNQGGGVGLSLTAELFLNFLFPGILIGMIFYGVISRAFYFYLKKNIKNRAVVLFYASVIFYWIVGLSSTDFVTTTLPSITKSIALLFSLKFITK